MAVDALARQRRLLLPLALLLAGSAAVAGGLAANLFSRPDPVPAPIGGVGAVACAPVPRRGAEPLAAQDPMAVLAAALGESRAPPPSEPRHRVTAAPLEGLLAASQDPPSAPVVPAPLGPAPPGQAQPGPAAAPAPAPALAAPVIAAGYRLDLGYFLAPDQAVAFATQVRDRGVPVQLLALPDASGRVWTHVRTPPFAGSAQALAGAERIEQSLGIPTRLVAPDLTSSPATGVAAP